MLVSWIYSRAAHWVLDRNGIQGQFGEVAIGNETSGEEDVAEEEDTQTEAADPTEVVDRLVDLYPRPDRAIYCIDLKLSNQADLFIDEIRRLAGTDSEPPLSLPVIGGKIDAGRRNDVPTLVSGDRLQPLHQLHGVRRFLFVRRVRRRRRRKHLGRTAGQLPQGLPGLQSRVSRERDYLSAA